MNLHRRCWPLLTVGALLAGCGGDRPPAPPAPVAAPPAPAVPVTIGDAVPGPMQDVPAGVFRPLFPGRDAPKEIPVAAFRLDATAVTNAQFLAFVGRHPEWRRSQVKRLFADSTYLADWPGDLDHGAGRGDRPVTGVSWFAARAYARSVGRRLPTTAEWEVAAALPAEDPTVDLTRQILEWYSRASRDGPGPVGQGVPNTAGLRDLHGLVWEWVEDYQTAMVTGDARGDSDLERGLFCGAGAVGAARPEDYAAFMRLAFRASLRAQYCGRNLGFRCAQDLAARQEER